MRKLSSRTATGIASVLMFAALPAAAQVATQTAPESASSTPTTQDSVAPETTPDAAAPGRDANEIVVTARKRTESVQNVPLAIAVVSGTRLQEQGLESVQSLQSVTSGLVVRKTPNNVVNLTLRGLGTGTAVDAFEQSVATFIDGTYLGRGPEFNLALFDVDRVEVIKGAQASLLSKNTSLGAISVTTRKPGDQLGGDISVSHEFELGSTSFQGGVDLPFSDTFKVRLAGQFSDNHGYVHNDLNGKQYPASTTYAGRATLQWKITDRLDATLVGQTFNLHQLGLPEEYVADPSGNIGSLAALAGYNGFETRLDGHTATGSQFGDAYDRTNGNRAILTLNYDLGADYSLTSVSSFSEFGQHSFRDTDFIPGDYVNAFRFQGNNQTSQELRVSSPSGEGRFFDFVGGLFYYHETWKYNQTVVAQCPGCNAAQLARFALRGAFYERDRQDTEDYSAFAQVNLHLARGLTLSGGGRFTHEDRTAVIGRTTLTPGLLTALIYQGFADTPLSRKENNFDGSAALSYKVNSDLLVYASFAKGTKSGGFLNIATTFATPAGIAAGTYGNEIAKTYEVGEKFTLPRGGFINVDGFWDRHRWLPASHIYQSVLPNHGPESSIAWHRGGGSGADHHGSSSPGTGHLRRYSPARSWPLSSSGSTRMVWQRQFVGA